MLTQTALTPLWGRACDLFGRRNCVVFCVGTFTIFSMACALSNSIIELIIFRALQGIGGGAFRGAAGGRGSSRLVGPSRLLASHSSAGAFLTTPSLPLAYPLLLPTQAVS